MRAGLIGAAIMFPIAAMEHALGFFSEGLRGLEQASEFLGAGITAMLIMGASAGWVLRGFAVRIKDGDEDEGHERAPHPVSPGPMPHGPAPHPAARTLATGQAPHHR